MKWSKGLFAVFFGSMMMLTALSYFISAALSGPYVEPLMIESKKGVQHKFKVEIAATPQQQERGLMYREQMAPDHGMLFEMGQPRVIRFWMKNTLIPLDVLFVAPDGTIKKIHANAEPRSLKTISSGMPVHAVLELNGGRAKELGIAAGDKVVHPYFSLPAKSE